MKGRKLLIVTIVIFSILLTTLSFYIYQIVKTPNILVEQDDRHLLIPNGATFDTVRDSLFHGKFLTDAVSFSFLAKQMDYQENVKPGRYLLKGDMTNIEAIRLLRSGSQTPVNITFNNVRTIPDLAAKICQNIHLTPDELLPLLQDSATIAQYGFSQGNIIGMFIPNTYEVYWTTSGENLLGKMYDEYQKFWNDERTAKANELDMNLQEVATLASIVEAEQLTHADERKRIAGLYINRLKRGMKLDSDPTLIFAGGDFTVKRVLDKDKEIDSPYNTYIHGGLPPGPIYLPSISSIDAVLNYESHQYLYMCAKEDFSGYHNFATNLTQHLRYARLYQNELNRSRVYR
ncbi:MAG: endolytic transglycosylase MltG [Cyclobacteriaceae bacterium]